MAKKTIGQKAEPAPEAKAKPADNYAPEAVKEAAAKAAAPEGGDIATSQTITYSMSGGLVP